MTTERLVDIGLHKLLSVYIISSMTKQVSLPKFMIVISLSNSPSEIPHLRADDLSKWRDEGFLSETNQICIQPLGLCATGSLSTTTKIWIDTKKKIHMAGVQKQTE